MPFASVEDDAASSSPGSAHACEEAGRDPATMLVQSAWSCACGRDDAEVARRAAAIGRDADELRANGVAGTPGRGGRDARPLRRGRRQRVYLQVLDLADLDHLTSSPPRSPRNSPERPGRPR